MEIKVISCKAKPEGYYFGRFLHASKVKHWRNRWLSGKLDKDIDKLKNKVLEEIGKEIKKHKSAIIWNPTFTQTIQVLTLKTWILVSVEAQELIWDPNYDKTKKLKIISTDSEAKDENKDLKEKQKIELKKIKSERRNESRAKWAKRQDKRFEKKIAKQKSKLEQHKLKNTN